MKAYLSLSIAPQGVSFFPIHFTRTDVLVPCVFTSNVSNFFKGFWKVIRLISLKYCYDTWYQFNKKYGSHSFKKNFVLILELQGWYIAIIIQGAESFHSGSEMAEYKATRRTNIR